MKVLRTGDTPEEPASNPIFIGSVTGRGLVTDAESKQVTVRLVRFLDGARNVLHVHTADQVLYITEGHGLVGTADEEHPVEAGDVAHIPAGEPHWHGAQPGREMAHLSILPPARRVPSRDRESPGAVCTGAFMGLCVADAARCREASASAG